MDLVRDFHGEYETIMRKLRCGFRRSEMVELVDYIAVATRSSGKFNDKDPLVSEYQRRFGWRHEQSHYHNKPKELLALAAEAEIAWHNSAIKISWSTLAGNYNASELVEKEITSLAKLQPKHELVVLWELKKPKEIIRRFGEPMYGRGSSSREIDDDCWVNMASYTRIVRNLVACKVYT